MAHTFKLSIITRTGASTFEARVDSQKGNFTLWDRQGLYLSDGDVIEVEYSAYKGLVFSKVLHIADLTE